MTQKPIIYLFHGDDEYALAREIAVMEAKMGDPGTAELNITRVEKGSLDLERIASATQALPFLTDRRMVILRDPLANLKSPSQRERFMQFLEHIPPTTALVIIINRPLQTYQEKKKNKPHWLQKWAQEQNGRVYEKEHMLLRGPQMIRWIQTHAREKNGEITSQAASLLSGMVGDNPRIAAQELDKLLAYVNYQRPVENDDVEHVVAYESSGNVFAMVDAIGMRDGRTALRILHKLLEDDEPLSLFGMIVRQFRLLLLTRELLDAGNRELEITRQLNSPAFVVRKLIPQTRNFTLSDLEVIYRRLLTIDEAIKTGQVADDIALDTLITALTI
ncbi:MAG: DNA polymerase III subunit delta [Chloroflexi bacterium]|nr:DNA polymerase III subunit delta [Chloroflexota bacterium]